MASRAGTQTIFDEISQQITDTFRGLIDQLTARMEQLLGEVRKKKEEFEQKLKSQKESLNKLEDIRIQIEQLSASQAQDSNLIQPSLTPVQKQIQDLKSELVQLPKLKFECAIPSQFRNLGAITLDGVRAIDYSSKIMASCVFGEQGTFDGGFQYLINLHIDGEELYVVDTSRVQVFNTINWRYKWSIALDQYFKPKAVAMTGYHGYILGNTQSEYMIHTFSKRGYAVKGRGKSIPFKFYTGSPDDPVDLKIYEGEIFVINCNFKTIHIYDLSLHYRRNIELVYPPKCIQFMENRLYVLDQQDSLHYYTIDGKPVGSSHQIIAKDSTYYHGIISFCFDPSGNAILVSSNDNRMTVVNQNGEKIYAIGKGTEYSEDISECNSVAVYQDKLIVTCPKWNCVKII